jgi:hypothetical protein
VISDIGLSLTDIETSDIELKRVDLTLYRIRINFYPISDIRHPIDHKSAQWLSDNALAHETKGNEFDPSL